ncbi:hypothetical protein CIK05_13625 [Bdellovibrio sp. qaytius]|nr:hypothetical protein CIK05_13625 [Bdellovibrio sp. qaytius]
MKSFLLILFFSFFTVFSLTAHAFKVLEIRNNKILVDLEGEVLERGDYLLTLPGAEFQGRAIVISIRPGQAIGKLQDGNFSVGEEVKRVLGEPSFKEEAIKISLQVKYLNNAISVKQKDASFPTPNSETVSMSGNSVGGFAVIDWPTEMFLLRGSLGYEPVAVKGTARFNSCSSKTSTNCTVDINYIAASAAIRYDYYRKSRLVTWVAAGSGIKFPLNKNSTSLNKGAIGIANSILLATGADYLVSKKYFVPVGLEYHYSLNYSEKVPVINQLALHAGVGMEF